MSHSKISVIIPAYNRADLIGDTINSILAQSMAPHEIIIVDDGSTDATADVIASFGSAVKLFRQKNLGAGAARNLGVKHSSGDLIHFMDSDDLSSPNTHEVQLKALNDSGADFAYGSWMKTRFDGGKLNCQKVVVQQSAVPSTPEMYKWLLRGWVTVFQPCMLTRDLVERVGPYRVDLKPSEDSELLFRIAQSGARFIHTPETLLLYRVHPEGQISTANTQHQRDDWVRYLSAIDDQLDGNDKLDLRTSIDYEFRKITAIRAEGVDQIEHTKHLTSTIPGFMFGLEKVSSPLRRLMARSRRFKFGENYMEAFCPAPMTGHQKELVKQMGYQLS